MSASGSGPEHQQTNADDNQHKPAVLLDVFADFGFRRRRTDQAANDYFKKCAHTD